MVLNRGLYLKFRVTERGGGDMLGVGSAVVER